ncbi:MAG: hypothetical protein QOH97_4024 [Actinoplanes sp.]|nr:hypothetical protein [Actinoplanes sp.]
MAGRMINGAVALAELIRPAGEADEIGAHRVLPVVPELSGLLPGRGLRRGSTVAVTTGGSSTGGSSAVGPSAGGLLIGGSSAGGLLTGGSLTGGPLPLGASRSGAWRVEGSPGGAVPAGWSSARAPGDSPAVVAGGSTSLLLALLAAASRAGSWCAVVGVPALGALAAAESGIVLDRLALIPHPGPEWPTVVAALIDGVDVVVVAVPGPIAPTIASRLVARARQRGCVLMPYGQWAGADVNLQVVHGVWEGLGAGHGRLRRREVRITARGRGAAARPKEITMWMPAITAPPPIPPAPAGSDPHSVSARPDPHSVSAVSDLHPALAPAGSGPRLPAGAGRPASVSAVVRLVWSA